MADRYFLDIADLAARRTALLNAAALALRRLLADIHSPARGAFDVLNESPLSYSVSVELALHQLRQQIVLSRGPDWVNQLNELSYAARALRRASELAQQSVTVDIRSDSNRHPK